MSDVLLVQVDGKIPNLALMRIAAHHRERGDRVWLEKSVHESLLDYTYDAVYGSAIFEQSLPRLRRLKELFPHAIIGGSALPEEEFVKLDSIGITTADKDYSIYPAFKDSLGYTQRGCRMKCSFCKVPWMEGKVVGEDTVESIWRGDPYPRNLLLLDNDFFGLQNWRENIWAMIDGGFKVSFNQGINARLLSEEACEALAAVRYYDDQFKNRRIYTAWDSQDDEHRLFTNLHRLVKYGVKPDHIMVYMLIGYWPQETAEDREYRRKKLRDFGARPYPMAYQRTKELVGFQRWVIGAYDKRVSWKDWGSNDFRPEGLGMMECTPSA